MARPSASRSTSGSCRCSRRCCGWRHLRFQQEEEGQQGEGEQEEQQDQQGEGQPQEGQPGEDQEGQLNELPAPGQRMTEEQAEQLLAAIARDGQTLQEKLGQIFAVPWTPPVQDW